MSNTETPTKDYKKLITVLSIAIPVAVTLLFGIKLDIELPVFLPPIYATINGITAILLILAVRYVKQGNIKTHELFIKLAMACSVVFLVMYVLYHMTSNSTPYGGEGMIKYLYYFILITHIALSVIVIPLVLLTFVKGLNRDIKKHKVLASFTYPIWLYVAVTGVIVYLMISPYYS